MIDYLKIRYRKECKRNQSPSTTRKPTAAPQPNSSTNQSFKMTPNPTPQQQSNKYYSSTPKSTPRTRIRTTPKPWVHSTREQLLTDKTFPNHGKPNYYSSTRKTPIKTTPKPWVHSTQPRPIQIDHGFKCKDSKQSNNRQAIRRDFDYFALSMNWPETACRFLMTKGKTCSIPGIDLMKFGDSDVGDIVMLSQHC